MKLPPVRLPQSQGKTKSFGAGGIVESIRQKSIFLLQKIKSTGLSGRVELLGQRSQNFLEDIKSIGFTQTMDDYEKRKLSIFNQLNFFQLVTGIIVPMSFLFGNQKFAALSLIVAVLPALVSLLVLILNFYYRYEAGMIVYFILYPLATSAVYLNGKNLFVELSFILYGILSVFFLQDISQMLFAVGLSMVSYFILSVVCKNYTFQLAATNFFLYLFNQLTATVLIFYGLFLVKKENTVYQFGILTTNRALQEKNREIQKQKEEIEEKAELLKKQTAELTELNLLKNKLFSAIAHDLKTPMYALRNLFSHIQQYDVPAKEIKSMMPDVVNDLNYTTGLMENLLQWAKSQMQSATVKKEEVNLLSITEEVIRLLHLQALAKRVSFKNKARKPCHVLADPDMISLVLRNLLSNAIKFTPPQGSITINITENGSFAEVLVEDTGIGISAEALRKINENNYYSTEGTSSESGTGLGLMLCKEFLHKNGSSLQIQSTPGKGSVFSFALPKVSGG